MSSRIFQSVILQLKDASTRVIGVIDAERFVVASSDLTLIGSRLEGLSLPEGEERANVFCSAGYTLRAVTPDRDEVEYLAFVSGEDELARCLCVPAAVALHEAKSIYDDRHDAVTFIKNILSDNILPGDVYVRAKELHFDTEAPRAVFIVRQSVGADAPLVELLQGMYPDREKNYILSMNGTDVVLIHQLSSAASEDEAERLAAEVLSAIEHELNVSVTIGIGTTVYHLRELADRYKEAQTAIEIGKVFESDLSIISYENLGIGRIIYQLPTTLCEMFLSEVFRKNSLDSLDSETLFTIDRFFENNLNVSETSRKLFIHRNTLVYRLEKIRKLTGLDLRRFDHAIVFKVALMVRKYLSSRNGKY